MQFQMHHLPRQSYYIESALKQHKEHHAMIF
jgi:hypothetical protein